jgi:hypothetical protein
MSAERPEGVRRSCSESPFFSPWQLIAVDLPDQADPKIPFDEVEGSIEIARSACASKAAGTR